MLALIIDDRRGLASAGPLLFGADEPEKLLAPIKQAQALQLEDVELLGEVRTCRGMRGQVGSELQVLEQTALIGQQLRDLTVIF